MSRLIVLGLLVGLAGCGSSIGALDGLPSGSDVSDVPWPRLVDTPEPPEARLTAGHGDRAAERLAQQRGAAADRQARAEAVAPVSETLVARGASNQARPVGSVAPVNEADLLARAARLRANADIAPQPLEEADLLARAELLRARAGALGSVNEPDLLARALRNRQSVGAPTSSLARTVPVSPRPPVPLRPLDTPVVSSDFENRARLARERAARL